MSTTIDSLQIEIQTSSNNAAQGIDALATSLEKLKKNGSFKTVSNNLNNLSTALNNLPNVHGASNALRTLANSIDKLKEVGSVSKIVNSLKKLPEALKAIEKINIDDVAPQIQKIADAAAPLSAVKAGGFGSMVNGMKNLAKVTQSLDDDTIKAFADKIKVLNTELAPFAEKMSTVKSAFGAINAKARSAASGVKQFSEDVDASTLNLSSFIDIVRTAVDMIQNLIQQFTAFISEAIEWDGVAARFGRGFAGQASETYAWIQRLNEEMGINVQQFMQYSSVYATMLTGFGVANEDASKMALGYTELTYDIWAGYNDIYHNFADAADAIKSAIAGEVEPIRRAGFTIVESTLEQTAANHGLEISLYNATEAQKSYLRYLTLVDQAHAQNLVGTYAKEMNTAEGVMRTFSQQLKSLTQAFGSLFLPVLVKVMPWLQAFVELLTEGVYWAAGLFGIEIQAVDFSGYEQGAGAIENVAGAAGSAADALGSATQAAKELKNATLGIDELNVISPPSSSSGGGGAGGGGGSGGNGFDGIDVDSLWDESIFDSVQSKVDEIKTKLKGMFDDWLPSLQIIGGALGAWSIAKLLDQLGEAMELGDNFHGTVTNIKKLAGTAIIMTIQFKLMKDAFEDFMSEDGTILDYIEGVLIGAASTYLLYKTWGVGGLAIGLGVTAAVSLKTVIDAGGVTDMESATVAITGLASAIGAFAIAIKGFTAAWAAIKGSAVVAWILEYVAAAKAMAPEVGWMSALFPKLSSALSSLASAIAGLSGSAIAAIAAVVAAVGSMVYFIIENWNELGQAFKDFFDPKFAEIGKHFEKIKEVLEPLAVIAEPIVSVLGAIIDKIVELVSSVDWLKVLGTTFEWLGGIIFGSVTSTIMGAINAVISAFEGLVQSVSGVVQIIGGLITAIVKLFSGDLEGAKDAVIQIGQGILDVFVGVFKSTIGTVYSFVEGVIKWFTELWDVLVGHSIVPDTVNAIVDWFTSLPGKIWGSIEKFVAGIVDKFKNLGSDLTAKFSSAWDAVKSWWNNSKEALKPYTPSIGDIQSKVSSAWTTAKNWWNDKKATLKSYTPSIGSIYENLKSRWDSARTWWNEKKSALKSYTPSIGSIYEKVSERWNNARDWWNNKKSAMKAYTPSIGSIVDKVKSAWNSAKSWWNKNVSLSTKLNIKVPTIEVKWKTATAFGKEFKYPTGFNLKFAANGGIFDQGSLIWAGERGPEVMATAAGGKTGVMNVQQMSDAMYEAVYSAMITAMKGFAGGGSQDVNVYLDGKEITNSVEKHQRERGADIMGSGVYSH